MLATPDVQELRYKRVAVTLDSGESLIGILNGLTDEKLFLGQDSYEMSDVTSISAAPLFCSTCGDPSNTLFDGLDAKCFREEAKRRPTPQEPCDECGAPAVRQPGTDKFLCTRHHAEAGHRLTLHGSAHSLLADCYTEDVSSDKHDWSQVRGARFRCVRCLKAEKYDPELLRQLTQAVPDKE